MSIADELVKAIHNRIAAGYTKEEIKAETLAAGHKEEIFDAAYLLAMETNNAATAIPSVLALWKAGFAFMRGEWKFTLLLGLPLVVMALPELIWSDDSAVIPDTTVLAIVSGAALIGILVYVVLLVIALRVVTTAVTPIDYRAAGQWAKQHWAPLFWIYLLSFFIIIGGFMLFIIPGIVLSATLYFSWHAHVLEGKRGEAALQYSRALVSGRFWLVVQKLVGLSFISVFFVFLFMAAFGIVATALPGALGDSVWVAYTFASQFLGAAITIISLRASYLLYTALKESADTEEEKGMWPYRLVGVFGFLALGAVGGSIVYLLTTETGQSLLQAAEFETQSQLELSVVAFPATSYQLINGSFSGVCEEIRELPQSGDAVACNDSETAWALAVEQGDMTHCIDSTGYNKPIEVPLNERTKCLPL